MDGDELRLRLDRLRLVWPRKWPYTELALMLGLSDSGLHKQMNGVCPVSGQTKSQLELFEDIVELTRMMTPEQKREALANAVRRGRHHSWTLTWLQGLYQAPAIVNEPDPGQIREDIANEIRQGSGGGEVLH